jgi:hypothetical protein
MTSGLPRQRALRQAGFRLCRRRRCLPLPRLKQLPYRTPTKRTARHCVAIGPWRSRNLHRHYRSTAFANFFCRCRPRTAFRGAVYAGAAAVGAAACAAPYAYAPPPYPDARRACGYYPYPPYERGTCVLPSLPSLRSSMKLWPRLAGKEGAREVSAGVTVGCMCKKYSRFKYFRFPTSVAFG